LGTNSYPGAIQVGRLLLTNRRPVWGRWWATMRGRWMGWRIYRTGAVLRVGAGRDAPLVPGAIHDSPPSLTTSAIQPRADVKIRILLVSPIGEIGGGEQVLLRVAEGLRQRGHEAALACMRPGPLLEAARRLDIAAHAFEPHRYRQLLQVRRGRAWLTRLAREEGADLLHANHTAQIYASSAGRGAGIGVVWHLHDFAYKFDWVERWCQLLPFDHVIFTTEKVRSGYPRFARRPQSVIAPVTVDPQRLLGVRPDSSVRDRLGLESGPILLTVARLQEHKGHADLLNAVPMVLKQFPDAQFLIVGKASGSQQEQYLQGLRGQAENLGISRSVKFTGFVEETELVWLYREATALVHPARSEGFGLTLLEAMAFGLPVIAADADGPRGIIGDGPAGRLVRRGDCGALAGAIVELLADPAEARRRAAGGLDPRYQLSTMVDQTLCVYQSVLGRRTRSESP